MFHRSEQKLLMWVELKRKVFLIACVLNSYMFIFFVTFYMVYGSTLFSLDFFFSNTYPYSQPIWLHIFSILFVLIGGISSIYLSCYVRRERASFFLREKLYFTTYQFPFTCVFSGRLTQEFLGNLGENKKRVKILNKTKLGKY